MLPHAAEPVTTPCDRPTDRAAAAEPAGCGPELLSPAGDWECLRAAVANGADAVYFGLANFNARHRATNFGTEELPEILAFLHRHNVRGYVTCNTLIFSAELAEVAALIEAVAAAGADALIVQDLGVAALAHRLAPGLSVHASTQMTLSEPRAIEVVRALGIARVILPRELSLEEIGRIRQVTDLPVEVFVHGALCVAYSGQCLTSEALGGRSANRGQCAQACRLPYELIVDGQVRDLGEQAYLLSPQDLAGHDQVADLARLGVSCLKIEGRLKSAQYVAATTRVYRQALDSAAAGRALELARQDQLDLAQSFSRGFTPGFLTGVDHQRLVHARFPKSRGIQVGHVLGVSGNLVRIRPVEAHWSSLAAAPILKAGDGIVFDEGHPDQDEQGGRITWVAPRACAADQPPELEVRLAVGAINAASLQAGSRVWKTDDPDFRQRMEQTYARVPTARPCRLNCRLSGSLGGALVLDGSLASGQRASVSWAGPLEAARTQPLSLDTAWQQLGRLGETRFALGEVVLNLAQPVMVPKSILNKLRRELVAQLEVAAPAGAAVGIHPTALAELRAEASNGGLAKAAAAPSPSGPVLLENGGGAGPHLAVLVRTEEQLQATLEWATRGPQAAGHPFGRPLIWCDFEDIRRYPAAVERAHAAGVRCGVATLRIFKPLEEGLVRKIAQAGAAAILVRNLGSLHLLQELAYPGLLVGDFALNVTNELSAAVLRGFGLTRLTPGYDMNWEQLAALLDQTSPALWEVVVHQHLPMFHNEHCVFAATLSQGKDWRDCGRPCDTHRVELRDRAGAVFPLLADTGCRNTLFNALPQSASEYIPRLRARGIRHYRVELLRESAAQVVPLLDRYVRVLTGQDDGRQAWRGLQVLSQLGVTRGTLGQA